MQNSVGCFFKWQSFLIFVRLLEQKCTCGTTLRPNMPVFKKNGLVLLLGRRKNLYFY